MIDNRGTILEVGQEVAFNLSGQIAKGRIVRIKNRTGYTSHSVEVELLHSACGKSLGHISKLKQDRNLLVLLKEGA